MLQKDLWFADRRAASRYDIYFRATHMQVERQVIMNHEHYISDDLSRKVQTEAERCLQTAKPAVNGYIIRVVIDFGTGEGEPDKHTT